MNNMKNMERRLQALESNRRGDMPPMLEYDGTWSSPRLWPKGITPASAERMNNIVADLLKALDEPCLVYKPE